MSTWYEWIMASLSSATTSVMGQSSAKEDKKPLRPTPTENKKSVEDDGHYISLVDVDKKANETGITTAQSSTPRVCPMAASPAVPIGITVPVDQQKKASSVDPQYQTFADIAKDDVFGKDKHKT
ncbi:hypothetical protein M3Y95_01022500 [Aphelenchoides besseyi]|nr:hypothetical protein M3Y95_01022500 [Aphelenchoides besseyi]